MRFRFPDTTKLGAHHGRHQTRAPQSRSAEDNCFGPLTRIGLRLPNPGPRRLAVDTQIRRDLRDRPL